MANTSSAKKAVRKIERRTAVNRARRSRMRTYLRKVEEALAAGDATLAATALRQAEPELMRAAQHGEDQPDHRAAQPVARRHPEEGEPEAADPEEPHAATRLLIRAFMSQNVVHGGTPGSTVIEHDVLRPPRDIAGLD